jgi:hypothetical protein
MLSEVRQHNRHASASADAGDSGSGSQNDWAKHSSRRQVASEENARSAQQHYYAHMKNIDRCKATTYDRLGNEIQCENLEGHHSVHINGDTWWPRKQSFSDYTGCGFMLIMFITLFGVLLVLVLHGCDKPPPRTLKVPSTDSVVLPTPPFAFKSPIPLKFDTSGMTFAQTLTIEDTCGNSFRKIECLKMISPYEPTVTKVNEHWQITFRKP